MHVLNTCRNHLLLHILDKQKEGWRRILIRGFATVVMETPLSCTGQGMQFEDTTWREASQGIQQIEDEATCLFTTMLPLKCNTIYTDYPYLYIHYIMLF